MKDGTTMNKRSIFVIIALIIVLIITGCSYEKKDKTSDALKFKEEYESINGESVEGTDYKVRTLSIPEDNPIVYADANDIITMMDNNDTFVVYFGFNSCPSIVLLSFSFSRVFMISSTVNVCLFIWPSFFDQYFYKLHNFHCVYLICVC